MAFTTPQVTVIIYNTGVEHQLYSIIHQIIPPYLAAAGILARVYEQ